MVTGVSGARMLVLRLWPSFPGGLHWRFYKVIKWDFTPRKRVGNLIAVLPTALQLFFERGMGDSESTPSKIRIRPREEL